jgi:hypothetical protein
MLNCAEVVPQLLAAAVSDPGCVLHRQQAERYRGEEVERGRLALPVVRRRVADLGVAAGDRVERLERRHQLPRGEHLHLDLAL